MGSYERAFVEFVVPVPFISLSLCKGSNKTVGTWMFRERLPLFRIVKASTSSSLLVGQAGIQVLRTNVVINRLRSIGHHGKLLSLLKASYRIRYVHDIDQQLNLLDNSRYRRLLLHYLSYEWSIIFRSISKFLVSKYLLLLKIRIMQQVLSEIRENMRSSCWQVAKPFCAMRTRSQP